MTKKNIRRGSFPSVPDLIASIENCLRVTNNAPKPPVWTASADAILEKVRRGRVALNIQSANTETHRYRGEPSCSSGTPLFSAMSNSFAQWNGSSAYR